MLTSIKFNSLGRRLKKRQKETFLKGVILALNAKSPEENAEGDKYMEEAEMLKKAIAYMKTEYYEMKFKDLIEPTPKEVNTEMYYKYNFEKEIGEKYIFTDMGFYKMRKLVRQRQKERIEIIGLIVTMVTGVLGTVIGLIAIIKS